MLFLVKLQPSSPRMIHFSLNEIVSIVRVRGGPELYPVRKRDDWPVVPSFRPFKNFVHKRTAYALRRSHIIAPTASWRLCLMRCRCLLWSLDGMLDWARQCGHFRIHSVLIYRSTFPDLSRDRSFRDIFWSRSHWEGRGWIGQCPTTKGQ